MQNVLITGGAGFVGSNLAVSFKRSQPDLNIVALDNLKRRGSELNLTRLKKNGVRFAHGDIRNSEDLELEGFAPELIIECSAEPSVLAGYNSSPRYAFNTNLTGTFNCLEAARRFGSDFIFLSTSRVYPIEGLNSLSYIENGTRFALTDGQISPGASSEGVTREFPLNGRRSLYGATKLSSEHLIEEYSAMYGMRSVINRCGVIAGPWQMGKADQGVFVHWLVAHYFRRALAYLGFNGSGKQVRDLLHIDDLFSLIRWQAMNIGAVNGRVFNVGGGRHGSLSLLETTELCREITGNRIDITGSAEGREADVRVYISDLSHVSKETGWAPVKTPAGILNDIFVWIRENERALKDSVFS